MQAIVHTVQNLAHKFDAGPDIETPLEVVGAIANLADAMQVLQDALAFHNGAAERPLRGAERAEQDATTRASGMFPLRGTMDLAPMRSDQDPQK